jgi:hypothetical protein
MIGLLSIQAWSGRGYGKIIAFVIGFLSIKASSE